VFESLRGLWRVVQLVERLTLTQDAEGSSPSPSTQQKGLKTMKLTDLHGKISRLILEGNGDLEVCFWNAYWSEYIVVTTVDVVSRDVRDDADEVHEEAIISLNEG
jgi:hypothetical protein